jgi:hypothetical protein
MPPLAAAMPLQEAMVLYVESHAENVATWLGTRQLDGLREYDDCERQMIKKWQKTRSDFQFILIVSHAVYYFQIPKPLILERTIVAIFDLR